MHKRNEQRAVENEVTRKAAPQEQGTPDSDAGVTSFERCLASLVPRTRPLERDRLMYLAGLAAAQSATCGRVKLLRAWAVCATAVSLMLTLLLVHGEFVRTGGRGPRGSLTGRLPDPRERATTLTQRQRTHDGDRYTAIGYEQRTLSGQPRGESQGFPGPLSHVQSGPEPRQATSGHHSDRGIWADSARATGSPTCEHAAPACSQQVCQRQSIPNRLALQDTEISFELPIGVLRRSMLAGDFAMEGIFQARPTQWPDVPAAEASIEPVAPYYHWLRALLHEFSVGENGGQYFGGGSS